MDAPPHSLTGLHRKVLVAFDASESAIHALGEAVQLALALGLELHALWIEEPLTPAAMFVDCGDAARDRVWAEQRADRQAQYRRVQEHLHELSASSRVSINLKVRRSFQRVGAILKEASAGAYSLLVVGNPKRPKLRHRLFGSTADWINHRATCDVLVVREKMSFDPLLPGRF